MRLASGSTNLFDEPGASGHAWQRNADPVGRKRFCRMMKIVRWSKRASLGVFSVMPLVLFSVACSPEVGSDEWCEKMKETPRSDWSATDATEFAKNCVFK